ncbi:MAG: hypothetical protein WC205_08525 [Opitutaceae bacterium]|jgi:hypothetical protein
MIKSLALGMLLTGCVVRAAPVPPAAITQLGEDISRRFIVRPQGLLLDYANLDGSIDLPNAEDCELGRPNALSWWTPLENGPFLTGLYLDGVMRRHATYSTPADAALARELAAGLLRCADPGKSLPGFVARGVYGPDLANPSFYGVGSDDQTAPWFFGLWRYLNSGLPSKDEAAHITATLVKTAEALRDHRWNMPCAPVGDLAPCLYRGGWRGPDFRGATRLLFVSRIMYELTRDPVWRKTYDDQLTETFRTGDAEGLTRLDIVSSGMMGEWKIHPELRHHLWIYVISQAMLDELARLETRDEIRSVYIQAIQDNALASADIVIATAPATVWTTPFRTDWKTMSALWRPQNSPDDAVAVAMAQSRAWANRGRELEITWIREPACAAWIAFYAPSFTLPIEAAAARFQHFIRNTDWPRLHASHGLFAESAYHLLESSHPGTKSNANARPPVAEPSSPAPATRNTASPTARPLDSRATRCLNQFSIVKIPPALEGATIHLVPRGDNRRAGASFTVQAPAGSVAWLLVMDKGDAAIPSEWELQPYTLEWDSGQQIFQDRVYRRVISADTALVVPESVSRDAGGNYAIPHALVLGVAK